MNAQPDYFANHEKARKFPWTLYHTPLERDLARFLPDAAIERFAKLVRWAVSDPIVAVDSPHAYEYMIVAEAAEPLSR